MEVWQYGGMGVWGMRVWSMGAWYEILEVRVYEVVLVPVAEDEGTGEENFS